MKISLKQLACDISEKEYREDSALSYSILSKYEKGGFGSISKLYEQQESEALTFGSMVDCLITEGKEIFDSKFAVVSNIPSESIEKIINQLVQTTDELSLSDISDNEILNVCDTLGYQTKWKAETRINKVRTEGTDYFFELANAKGKRIVDLESYQKAIDTVIALKSHPYVGKYFEEDSEYIEHLYQVKFKETIDEIPLKCMFDLLIVNHKDGVIIPCDLKTSSVPEYDFAKKYLEWRYDIQSRLYYKILSKKLSENSYFKGFKLQPFRFIVINKNELNPLTFVDPYSIQQNCDIKIKFKSERVTILRDPVVIAKELNYYLVNGSKVPNTINTNSLNYLNTEIEKL